MSSKITKTDSHQGVKIIPLLLLSTAAIILSYQAHASCDYFSRKLVSFDNRYEFLVGDVQFISMFSYQQASDGACNHYATDTTYFDPRFKASRALSVFTIVAGGLLLVILWLAACTKISLPVWYITASFLLINSTAEGLVLLLKSSAICDETYGICSLARGSEYGIGAIVGWFLSGFYVALVTIPLAHTSGKDINKTSTQMDNNRVHMDTDSANMTEV